MQERHESILEPSKHDEAVCDMRFRVQDHLRVVVSIRPELFDIVHSKYPNLVSQRIFLTHAQTFFNSTSRVFQPANRCFTGPLVVKILFLIILTSFPIKIKKKTSKIKLKFKKKGDCLCLGPTPKCWLTPKPWLTHREKNYFFNFD